jgi:hypothetical protein
MRDSDIDGLVDSVIEEERTVPINPFLATRVMVRIQGRSPRRRPLIPAWQGVSMALSFVLVIILGIKEGNLYKTAEPYSKATSVTITSDDNMEHFEFYRQIVKE